MLNILVSEIVLEPGCANLLYHAWYLDDGVVAGSSTEVCRVLAILEERGHSLWDYMSKLINVKFFVTAT